MTYDETAALIILANDEATKGNLDVAEDYATKALDGECESAALRAEATIALANITFRRGNFQQALSIALASLDISGEHNLTVSQSKGWHTCGNISLSLGSYDRALKYYEEALSAYLVIGHEAGVASITGNIGIVCYSLGLYDKALDYYDKALAAQEKLGQTSEIANVNASIGNVYVSLGTYDKALEYFTQALGAYSALEQKSGVAGIMGNIGIVYQSHGAYDKALEYFGKALAANEELGRKSGVAHATGNIGNVYSALGSYDKAYEYYRKALSIFIELTEKSEIANFTGSIGALYAVRQNTFYDAAKAEEFLLKALVLSEEIKTKGLQVRLHKSLADLYENERRDTEALVHFKQYHELEKEVQSGEAKKQAVLMEQRRQAADREKEIAIAKAAADAKHQATEQLLHNVLPPSIANKMLDGTKLIAEKIPSVSVLFADIVDFTKLSQRITPEELVEGLDRIFSAFDALAERYGLEKIKTIGDAYMVVSGAPIQREDHAEAMAHFALEMVEAMKEFRSISTGEEIQLRIGIHSGEVVAGVIGKKKFAYDLWGDAVNTASRMESHGEAGKIHVSEEFKHAVETLHATSLQFATHNTTDIADGGIEYAVETLHATSLHAETLHATSLQFIPRGEMDIKGKGMMKTYFLEKA